MLVFSYGADPRLKVMFVECITSESKRKLHHALHSSTYVVPLFLCEEIWSVVAILVMKDCGEAGSFSDSLFFSVLKYSFPKHPPPKPPTTVTPLTFQPSVGVLNGVPEVLVCVVGPPGPQQLQPLFPGAPGVDRASQQEAPHHRGGAGLRVRVTGRDRLRSGKPARRFSPSL